MYSGRVTEDGDEQNESAPAPRPKRRIYFGPITIIVAIGVLCVYYLRQCRANRTHHVEFRALVDVESCRVRLEATPSKPIDPLALQTGVIAPWHVGFEASEGAELSLRIYGDATCGG